MSRITKQDQASRRQSRVRGQVRGTADRPRLSVRVSATNVYAQIIDDSAGKTIAAADSRGTKGSLTAKAEKVGVDIAAAAKKAKVSKVAFDRGAKIFHGRVAAVADAARKAGLEL